ncbi:MAG: hypothetical protein ABSG93_04700 [Solirubrobacteraceae bacterium]
MSSLRRIVPPVLIPVLVVVAIVGYLFGIHRASAPAAPSASAQQTKIASSSSVLLDYPASWQAASAAPAIPGLSIAHTLLLAPAGDADHAGLLSGQLAGGGPSPLPAAFLALVHGVPRTEVLSLANLQAYRYSGLSGYDRTLDLYVIPTVGASPTALVCYAASGFSAFLRQCEQIVTTVSLVGQTPDELSPEAAYAGQLSGLIGALERERVTLRREMHAQPADVGALATTLAARFADAASAVAALEPPQPASAAQAALASALDATRDAYTALAATAAGVGPAGYAGAERQINEAEAAVDSALESFALLGYNHA